jgi:serine protease AprX
MARPGSRYRVLGVALAALLLGTGSTAVAAPDSSRSGPPARAVAESVPPDAPGKGDSDGDRIADDLEAAAASAPAGSRLEVIVQGVGPGAARGAAPSLEVDRTYRIIPAFAGSVTAGQLTALARLPGVERVELNGVARTMDASGNRDYGVDAARQALPGLDGSGVGICIIDTGIDPNHEQLSGGRVVGWQDWVNGRTDPYDDHGHGTHVSGIAAGRSTGTNNQPYAGVAPGAHLIGAKVLNSGGSGADADVVSAIEWCAARTDVHVISMSLGSPGSDGRDAGSQAANAAVKAGKVVVAAAGNSGDAPGTVSSPGVATDVITVGAGSDASSLAGSTDTDVAFYLAGFSSRGPTANPDAPQKPDIVGPGLSVVAARAGTVSSYVTYSGTSMATPFVAGVVALGIDADGSATPAQLKAALRASARDAGAEGPDPEWGAGMADARAFLGALGALSAASAPGPAHALIEGSVPSGTTRNYPIEVTIAGSPLGVTLETTNGAASCLLPVGDACWWGYEWAPDLDAYLVNPSGTVVAASRCMLEATNGNCAAPGRFETLSVASAAAGTWTLRVESFSGSGTFRAAVLGAVGEVAPPPPPDPEPLAAPTGLTASDVTDSSVRLTWVDNASDETGYVVQRCTGAGCSDFTQVASLGVGVTSWTDSGLAAASTYRYQVAAVRVADVSAWAGPITVTTGSVPPPPPPAELGTPTGLTANALSANQIVLSWSYEGAEPDSFTVQRCTGNRCTPSTTVGTPDGSASNFTDSGLAAATTYRYWVRAELDGQSSEWSAIASAKTKRR